MTEIGRDDLFRLFLGKAIFVCLVFGGALSAGAQSKKSLAKIIGEYPVLAERTGVEWYYNWSGYPAENVPNQIEFVPMVWGGCRTADGSIDLERLRVVIRQVLAANPKCRYLLAFNEPDKVRQSNFSVKEVLRAWPVFEQETRDAHIQLGSPGVAGINSQWLHEFMAGVEERNLRVDFLCVHRRVRYGNSAADKVIRECRRLYDRYHLPVWITELELVGSDLTEEQVIWFYQEFAGRLDSSSRLSRIIERYAIAYAPPDTEIDYKKVARPVTREGKLTDFGKAFAGLPAE